MKPAMDGQLILTNIEAEFRRIGSSYSHRNPCPQPTMAKLLDCTPRKVSEVTQGLIMQGLPGLSVEIGVYWSDRVDDMMACRDFKRARMKSLEDQVKKLEWMIQRAMKGKPICAINDALQFNQSTQGVLL